MYHIYSPPAIYLVAHTRWIRLQEHGELGTLLTVAGRGRVTGRRGPWDCHGFLTEHAVQLCPTHNTTMLQQEFKTCLKIDGSMVKKLSFYPERGLSGLPLGGSFMISLDSYQQLRFQSQVPTAHRKKVVVSGLAGILGEPCTGL